MGSATGACGCLAGHLGAGGDGEVLESDTGVDAGVILEAVESG